MATSTKTLRRRTIREAYSGKVRIDKDAGVIFDVKVIGKTSINKREYTDGALDGALELYEGAKLYIDHKYPGRGLAAGASRSMRDWAGVLRNCRRTPDGVRGDVHYLKKAQAGMLVAEAAEKFPDKFGLSQHATVEYSVRASDGWTIVERIVEVKSVDVVDNPAATTSLFEGYGMDETTPAVAPPMSVEDAFLGLQNAVMASTEHDDTERLAVLKDIMKLKAKVLGTADDSDEAGSADDGAGEAQESVQTPVPAPAVPAPKKGNKLRRELRENKIRLMILSEGVKVEETVIESMIDMGDDGVKSIIAELKKGQRPRYGQAPARTGGRKDVSESTQDQPKKPEIPTKKEELLAWLSQD